MTALRSLWWLFLLYLAVSALFERAIMQESPFSCTGGSVYFTAHPVDSLLFQNPDLLHDLYVFRCTTTVVFTSGNHGETDPNMLERGLEEAHVLMAELPSDQQNWNTTTVRLGNFSVKSWSLHGMPNIQILYVRLPDSAPSGQGYEANGNETLLRLYNKEIESITTTDGNATYTLKELEAIVTAILRERKPNKVQTLNHKASMPREHSSIHDHADHIITAQLVRTVIERENMTASLQAYAGNNARKLEANIDHSHNAYGNKTEAYFKYAEYDEYMCHNADECSERLEKEDETNETSLDDDAKYVAQYLEREYYVT